VKIKTTKNREIIFALDVSNRMLAQDVKPNRLHRAKQIISELYQKNPYDRMGLIIFAGEAFVQIPLTSNFSNSEVILSSITPDVIPVQGTNLSQAIDLSVNMFDKSDTKSQKLILILTDGENHEQKAIDAAKKAKVKAMVGMNFRFRPDAMLLKSLINSNELGDLFYIRCGWSRKQSSKEKWFRKKTESGGGVLIDLGIVLLDLGIWFLDYPPVKSVSVQTYSHKVKGVEDSAVGFLRFKNGSVINFEVSWSLHSEKDSFNLTAFGTEGTGHLNPFRAYKRVDSARIDYTPTGSANKKNLYKKSYENELKHFISSIRGNTPFLSSSEEAVTRMKLLEAIYESAEKEKEIILK